MSSGIGRILLGIVTLVVAGFYTHWTTQDLRTVPKALDYRIAYYMLVVRGLTFLWFDVFKLFPLE